MANTFIPLNGGLVTSRDKSVINPGELQKAENAEYRPDDQGLWKVPGRTAYNSAEGAPIDMVAYAEHEDTADRLLVAVNGEIKQSTLSALTGALSAIPEFTGFTESDGATTDSTTVQTSSTYITAPDTALVVNYLDKYYYMDGVNGPYVIGNHQPFPYDGSPVYSAIKLRMAAAQLPSANTGTGDTSGDNGFTLGNGNKIAYWATEVIAVPTAAPSGTELWRSLDADDIEILIESPPSTTQYITGTAGSAVAKIYPEIFPPTTYSNAWSNGFKLYCSATEIDYPVANAHGISTNGGPTVFHKKDASLYPFADQGADIGQFATSEADPLSYINFQQGPYPIVVTSIYGLEASSAKYGQYPLCSVGDIFEDSLVVNDVNNKTSVWFSFPDEPEAIPTVNFIRFETRRADEVTMIRSINDVCIVCLKYSTWALRHLPRPEDAEFDRGRAKRLVSNDVGCVGPLAADTFSFGSGERLAFVSYSGIIVTDGASWDIVTDDIDWQSLVEFSALDKSILKNNPKRWRLEFYYTPNGGTSNTKCLYLNYHPSHNKTTSAEGDFRAKVSGPIDVVAKSATSCVLSGQTYMLTGNSDGVIYVEGQGSTDVSGAGSDAFVVETGEIYAGGLGTQSRIVRVLMHTSGGETSQSADVTMTLTDTESVDTVLPKRTHSIKQRGLIDTDYNVESEAVAVKVEIESGAPVRINGLAVEGEETGGTREP